MGGIFKRTAYYISLCAAMLILLLSLSACYRDPLIIKEGITVEPSERLPYSEAVKERAREVIYSFLSDFYSEKGYGATEDEIIRDTDRLCAASESVLISEESYTSALESLDSFGEELISAVLSLLNGEGEEGDISLLGQAYLALTKEANTDFAGSVVYEICIFIYDKLYEEQYSLYESVGKEYHLVLANQYKSEKKIFEEEIGRDNCRALINLTLFFRGLFVGGALNEGVLSGFTDTEVLLLLQELDFSAVNIGARGYKLLADYYSDTLITKDETTYFDEILYEAVQNGDFERAADGIDELSALINSVKEKLSGAQIALLRKSDFKSFVCLSFENFDDEDFLLFEEVFSAEIAKARYERIAKGFFGEDFEEYSRMNIACTREQLRAAVGKDNFYNALEGYVFGISPAFSYLMSND